MLRRSRIRKGCAILESKESALDHAAFGRDVEFAQPGIDERQQGGQQNVGREHGFVNVVPEE